jgi:dynactin 1
MPHISDARSSKAPFQLAKVMSFVQQTAASTVGKGTMNGATSWQAVSDYVASISREIGALVPEAMEQENVAKSSLFKFGQHQNSVLIALPPSYR